MRERRDVGDPTSAPGAPRPPTGPRSRESRCWPSSPPRPAHRHKRASRACSLRASARIEAVVRAAVDAGPKAATSGADRRIARCSYRPHPSVRGLGAPRLLRLSRLLRLRYAFATRAAARSRYCSRRGQSSEDSATASRRSRRQAPLLLAWHRHRRLVAGRDDRSPGMRSSRGWRGSGGGAPVSLGGTGSLPAALAPAKPSGFT